MTLSFEKRGGSHQPPPPPLHDRVMKSAMHRRGVRRCSQAPSLFPRTTVIPTPILQYSEKIERLLRKRKCSISVDMTRINIERSNANFKSLHSLLFGLQARIRQGMTPQGFRDSRAKIKGHAAMSKTEVNF